MGGRIAVSKVRFKDEERFIIQYMVERQKPNDPFMRTSDLGNPLTKEDAVETLRRLEVPEADIQSLMAHSEGSPC